MFSISAWVQIAKAPTSLVALRINKITSDMCLTQPRAQEKGFVTKQLLFIDNFISHEDLL